jgi:hypothetical protein
MFIRVVRAQVRCPAMSARTAILEDLGLRLDVFGSGVLAAKTTGEFMFRSNRRIGNGQPLSHLEQTRRNLVVAETVSLERFEEMRACRSLAGIDRSRREAEKS